MATYRSRVRATRCSPRRTRPRRLPLWPPKATNADTHQHAAGARRGGAGSGPAGRQAAAEALDPSRGGISTKIHLAVCIKIQRHASG